MKVFGSDLLFAKVRHNAIIPTKRIEDAAYDFYACTDEDIVIEPHETKLIPTGIACAINDDYFLYLVERGSTGSKGMKKSAGVVDSGFRNEIFAAIYNGNDYRIIITDKVDKTSLVEGQNKMLLYPKSKAICQGLILPVPKMNVKEVSYEELQKYTSERGTSMLGASGK